MQIKKMSMKYNISESSIIKILKDNNVFVYKNTPWSKQELNIIREYYPEKSWDEILKLLPNRKKENIVHMASKLKIKRAIYGWSKRDITLLKQLYETDISIEEISEKLNNKFTMAQQKAHVF